MIRDRKEIKDALTKLETNLHTCVPYNCFGNDNKKQVMAMIDVITFNRSMVWINSAYLTISEMFHQNPNNVIWQSAKDAREWLDGDFPIEDLLFVGRNK